MEEEIKELKLKCSACGQINEWEPTIWSYVPHEPRPLICPNCGSTKWDDMGEEE